MSMCTCVLPFCDLWSMKVYSLFQPDKTMEHEKPNGNRGKNYNLWISEDIRGLSCHNLHNDLCVRARVNVPVCIFVYLCVCTECLYILQQKTKRWCTATDCRTSSLAPSTTVEVLLTRTMRTKRGVQCSPTDSGSPHAQLQMPQRVKLAIKQSLQRADYRRTSFGHISAEEAGTLYSLEYLLTFSPGRNCKIMHISLFETF